MPMYGYTIALIVGIILVGVTISLIGGGNQAAQPRRKMKPADKDTPVQADAPAADEPTPDRSAIASSRSVDATRKHTPPA